MIDKLLKIDLPQAYGLTRPNVDLTWYNQTGTFELGDPIACQSCKQKFPERNGCNEKTISIDAANYSIIVIDYENYINQFNGKQYATGGRCDLMMFDTVNHKVVFCDLGCCSEKYVEKKRVKSHQQVCDSLARFLRKAIGQNFINTFAEKVLIFGRRDHAVNINTSTNLKRGDVRGNMQAFVTTPISKHIYAISPEVVEGVNVNFVIVNYPNTYVW